MCGFTGFFHITGDTSLHILKKMTHALVHRGPDSQGYWQHPKGHIGLGHQRLAIQDLSPQGAQPFHSQCKRYTLVYNGEIYNAPTLKKELIAHGITFRGHSDTEYLIEAIACWGLEKTLQKCVGMFAFALFDHRYQTLQLVRDRLGKKPLYYSISASKTILFGSELKALWVHPEWQGKINANALSLYLRHGYIPTPHTIFQNVFKLKPGYILTLDTKGHIIEKAYWSFIEFIKEPPEGINNWSKSTWEDQIEQTIVQSIQERCIADVPIGAFLSGGIDSSLVVALMQKEASEKVHTFSIGFGNKSYNEAIYAKKIATFLETDHTELYVSEQDVLNVIPKIPTLFDEPFSDASQIPTYLVAQMARQKVKVILSGDGGDEFFAGYTRYDLGLRLWKILSKIPHPVRKMGKNLLQILPTTCMQSILSLATSQKLNAKTIAHKISRLQSFLISKDFSMFYGNLISQADPDDFTLEPLQEQTPWCALPQAPLAYMQTYDILQYLPDDILTKVDRTTMAHGLEARAPLIDHRLLKLAWWVPRHLLYAPGKGKIILKNILNRYLPKTLFDRPKMGFGVPMTEWIDGPLSSWADDTLNATTLNQSGLLNIKAVLSIYEDHKKGMKNPSILWSILLWQQWYNEHRSKIHL